MSLGIKCDLNVMADNSYGGKPPTCQWFLIGTYLELPQITSNFLCECQPTFRTYGYTLSEAWSGVNWADLMAAQGAFGTDFYDRSTKTIVGTMLWTEYRPVINISPKGALGSHEIRPIHSAPSLRQSIEDHGDDDTRV